METEATSLRGSVGSVTVAAEKPQARRCPRVIRSRVSVSVCVGGGWWWKEMGLVWAGSLRGMGWRGVALEQAERPGEKKLGEIKGPRPLLPRCRGRGAVGAEAMGGTNCVSAGLRRGRRAVAAPKEARSAIRVPRGSSSGHQAPRGPQRPGPLTILPPPLLPGQNDFPRLWGGRGLRPLPLFPALPCPAPRDPARPGPAQPLSTHGSDSSGGSSPAPASPPPTPGRSSAAGSEPRGAWRVGTRGAFAPGTGSWASPRLLAAPEPF